MPIADILSARLTGGRTTRPDRACAGPDRVASRDHGNPAKLKANFLESIIEREVIPRLVDDHPKNAAAMPEGLVLRSRAVIEKASLAEDSVAVLDVIEGLIERHFSPSTICREVLAPVAAGLGVAWEDDRLDFFQVTRAMGTLTGIAHRLSGMAGDFVSTRTRRRSVLLVTPIGEEHSFGLLIIGTHFRAAGFDVTYATEVPTSRIVDLLQSSGASILGISISRTSLSEPAGQLVGAVRHSHSAVACPILLGGAAVEEGLPDNLVKRVEGLASDQDEALKLIELWDEMEGRARA